MRAELTRRRAPRPDPLGSVQLGTHVMIQAPTGAGKSFLARRLVRDLLKRPPCEAAVFVDDPKGDLYAGVEEDCAALGLDERTLLFNTSRADQLLSFNPLRRNGLSPQDHALWVLGAYKAARGQRNFDETPQLFRWLHNATVPVIEGGGTMLDVLDMLDYNASTTRRRFLERTADPFIRQEWYGYEKLSPARRREETQSAFACVRPFVHNPTNRTILGPSHSSLDDGRVLREGTAFLSHIPRYRPLDPEVVNLLRSLLLQSLLAQAFHIPLGERPPLYLVLDEAEHLLERDAGAIETILNEGRSLGIHLVLIFHTFAQVAKKNPALLASVLSNCRTKILGGHIPDSDLEILTPEFFLEEWHPYIVRDEITGIEVEPVEEMRAQVSLSEGEQESLAHTTGVALASAIAKGLTGQVSIGRGTTNAASHVRNHSTSDTYQHADGLNEGDIVGASGGHVLSPEGTPLSTYEADGNSHARGRSSLDSYGDTRSEGEAWGRSKAVMRHITAGIAANIARTVTNTVSDSLAQTVGRSEQRGVTIGSFLKPIVRRRVTGRQLLSSGDFLTMKRNLLKTLQRGHWAIKPSEGRAVFFSAWGLVQPLLKCAARLTEFRERVFKNPVYPVAMAPSPPAGVDPPAPSHPERGMVHFSETPPLDFRE